VPDIVIQPDEGVIYTKPGKKIAEHGGFSRDDNNVALLISFAGINNAQQNNTPVQTMQIAATILKILGLNPMALQAVQKENTLVLPEFDTVK
jgi:phosphoglycerol transferase MdoB-like AlkP superfamily enzyme